MPHRVPSSTVSDYRVASASGTLCARVIRPEVPSGLPPLVVLHGISRNADALVDMFRPASEDTGRSILVPHFGVKDWPSFQRPSRSARPDQALLALLAFMGGADAGFSGRVDLFGHSGGAQLAHRFAMLFPHRVGRLNLAAAGWYCLPDTSMAYPYGLGADATLDALTWARRHQNALPEFLRLGVRVFVGTNDTLRDASLRQTPDLDRLQGLTRLARAETYVARFRAAAQSHGIVPNITLSHLTGVTHDVAQAIAEAGLARLVTQEITADLAVAC